MPAFLRFLSVCCLFVAIIVFLASKGAIHETIAALFFVAFCVLLSAAVILAELVRIRETVAGPRTISTPAIPDEVPPLPRVLTAEELIRKS